MARASMDALLLPRVTRRHRARASTLRVALNNQLKQSGLPSRRILENRGDAALVTRKRPEHESSGKRLRLPQRSRQGPLYNEKVKDMVKKAAVVLIGTLSVVACSQTSPTRPSPTAAVASSSSSSASSTTSTSSGSPLPAQRRVGFGFNGTVSGFPTGIVFLSGGGSYNRAENSVHAGGGFTCVKAVLQGPLSTSINPDDPGACRDDEGVRWDTASLLDSTTFKCTGAATEALKTAVTTDTTVVLQIDLYRASNGNNESFTSKMIVSDSDIAPDFPGVRLWVQGVGCGPAVANFSN